MFATLAGSYPWPSGTASSSTAPLRDVLTAQVDAGLTLLSDGRVHDLDGDLVASWSEAAAAAAEMAPGMPVKLAVAGPWSASKSNDGSVAAAAAAGNRALGALARAGCPYVEVHEAAAGLPGDAAAGAAFAAAHRALLAGLDRAMHRSLALVDGDASAAGQAIFAADYDSHLFDVIGGPDNWRLIAVAPPERGIVLGVVDAMGRRRIGLEEITWATGYAASTGGRGRVRVGIAPSGGLAGLSESQAREVIEMLGRAVEALSGDRDALLDRLDPRAIDARTAALGHAARPRRHPVPPVDD